MVPVQRPEPDAGAVREPEPPAFGLPLRRLEAFPSPDPLDALMVDLPAACAKQRRHTAVTVAAVLRGKCDDVFGQGIFIAWWLHHAPLRRPRLAQNLAGPSLGYTGYSAHVLDAPAPPGRAQKFPSAASFRMSLSSVSSATARLSLAWISTEWSLSPAQAASSASLGPRPGRRTRCASGSKACPERSRTGLVGDPASLAASAMVLPFATATSTCLSLFRTCSGE